MTSTSPRPLTLVFNDQGRVTKLGENVNIEVSTLTASSISINGQPAWDGVFYFRDLSDQTALVEGDTGSPQLIFNPRDGTNQIQALNVGTGLAVSSGSLIYTGGGGSGTGTIVNGQNLGSGSGIFSASTAGGILQFRSMSSTGRITISQQTNTVTVGINDSAYQLSATALTTTTNFNGDIAGTYGATVIQDNVVKVNHIRDGAVGAGKIDAAAVSNSNVIQNTLALDRLVQGNTGIIGYPSGTSNAANLSIGRGLQVTGGSIQLSANISSTSVSTLSTSTTNLYFINLNNNTPAIGSLAYFNGTNWVPLAGPVAPTGAGTYLLTCTFGGNPSWYFSATPP